MNFPHGAPPPAPKSQLSRLILVLILALSALIQLTVVSRTTVESPRRVDAGDYFSYAYNLRHHGVYSISQTWEAGPPTLAPIPDSFRPPGYPLFLAMVGMPEVTDSYMRRVSLAQAVLGVLSVLLIYLLSARFLGRNWSLAVALVTALSPHLAIISTLMLSESLFFFLLLASVYSSLKAVESPGRWQYVLAGVLWGMCSLVRSTPMFLPPLMLIAVFAMPRLRRFRLSVALGFLSFLVVLAPWLLRNQQDSVSKPESSLMVRSLAHGSYPGFMYEGRPETFRYPYRHDPDAEKIAKDLPSILRHIAGRFGAQPLTYLQWYLIGKPGYFLSWGNVQGWDILIYEVSHTPYFEDNLFKTIRKVSLILHWPLMVLGLAGALLVWLRPRWLGLDPSARLAAGIVALVFMYAIALHMIVAPFPRYGIPFRPLLFALAMLPLRAAWLQWRRSRAVPLH